MVADRIFPAEKEKAIKEALNACQSGLSGCSELQALAFSTGGFLKDKWRRKAWPVLLDVQEVSKEKEQGVGDGKTCPWAEQVTLDVRRTLKRFPPGIDDETRHDLQETLVSLICKLLTSYPDLHYYQGFHDMALTVLLVMRDEQLAYFVVESLTRRHLTTFMKPTMKETSALLDYIMAIVKHENAKLYSFLVMSDVGTTFSLSWVITWFSHCLDDYETIVRLFDAVIAAGHHASSNNRTNRVTSAEGPEVFYPLCISAHLVLARAKEIMCMECELSTQHAFLSKLPEKEKSWDEVLASGRKLMSKYSMKRLKKDAELYKKQTLARFHGEDITTPGLWDSIFCVIPFYDSKYHPSQWSPVYRVAFVGILAAGIVAWYLRSQQEKGFDYYPIEL